jgi:hypothetical protein
VSKKVCCERTNFSEIELLTGQCEYEACCVFEGCPCPLVEKVDFEWCKEEFDSSELYEI